MSYGVTAARPILPRKQAHLGASVDEERYPHILQVLRLCSEERCDAFIALFDPHEFGIEEWENHFSTTICWHPLDRNTSTSNTISSMKKNDLVLIFHFRCATPGVVGYARVVGSSMKNPHLPNPMYIHHEVAGAQDRAIVFQLQKRFKEQLSIGELMEYRSLSTRGSKTFTQLKVISSTFTDKPYPRVYKLSKEEIMAVQSAYSLRSPPHGAPTALHPIQSNAALKATTPWQAETLPPPPVPVLRVGQYTPTQDSLYGAKSAPSTPLYTPTPIPNIYTPTGQLWEKRRKVREDPDDEDFVDSGDPSSCSGDSLREDIPEVKLSLSKIEGSDVSFDFRYISTTGTHGIVSKGKYHNSDVAIKSIPMSENGWVYTHLPHTISRLKSADGILSYLIGYYIHQGLLHLIRKWYCNQDLRKFINLTSAEKVPLYTRLSMLNAIARTLRISHDNGIFHGNVRAENIMIGESLDDVALIDFGMPHYSQPLANTTHYRPYLSYIPPEQLVLADIDSSCDVFSFAIVLWEITSWKDISWATSDHTKQELTRFGRSDWRPRIDESVPWRIAALIQQCWSSKPFYRPQMEDVEETLVLAMLDEAIKDLEARNLWKNYLRGVAQVLWEDFERALLEYMNKLEQGVSLQAAQSVKQRPLHNLSPLTDRSIRKEVIRRIGGDFTHFENIYSQRESREQQMQRLKKVLVDEEGYVSQLAFGDVLKSFGPFVNTSVRPITFFLDQMSDMLRLPGFCGTQTRQGIENILKGAEIGEWVISVSEDPSQFIVSVKGNEISEHSISYDPYASEFRYDGRTYPTIDPILEMLELDVENEFLAT